MKIQDLPQPYRALAEMRREQQINSEYVKRYEKQYNETRDLNYAFDWYVTKEKSVWWNKVNIGNTPEIPAESLAELKEWQKETIKVRITKAEFDTFWYADQVGSVYEVKNTGDDRGYELLINGEKNWIGYKDCEIVPKEEWEVPNYEATVIAEQPKEETDWEKEYNSLSEKFESYKDLYDALLGKYETLEKVVEQIKIEKAKQKANDFVESVNEFNQSVSECFAGLGKLTESVEKERLFTAAVAAMQGFIASYAGATKDPDTEPVATKSWNYAEALINEGKKRNLL